MKKILNSTKHNAYASDTMIGKYVYFKTETHDAYLYYIFNIETINIIDSVTIKYNTNRCFLMFVPKDENLRSFLYDNYNEVIVKSNYELYELSFCEYVNTFRVFLHNDGVMVKDLPDKLIQDDVSEALE